METNLLLSARGEYMVDRIFQSMDSDGKNNMGFWERQVGFSGHIGTNEVCDSVYFSRHE